MKTQIIEAEYPNNFREEEAMELGQHIKNGHSVVLIGMKRVGISNFLRFFINHQEIVKKYISATKDYLFIPVDLNDLVEREFFPFWMLTLKRIYDGVESSNLKPEVKKYIEGLFLDSIQSKDLFLTIEYIRRSLRKILESGVFPVIFFIRFDRLRHIATREFLYNLEGLKEAAHNNLSLIFTSFKRLDHLNPEVFSQTSLSLASNTVYFKPGKRKDLEIISETYVKRYNLNLTEEIKKTLFELVDGYVQYMQLALIILNENPNTYNSAADLFKLLINDERISLQSEELWDSLNDEEKEVLIKITQGQEVKPSEKEKVSYIFDTGFVTESGEEKLKIFSPIFEHFLSQMRKKKNEENLPVEFTKKENLLFNFLQKNLNEICERESIIEAVWPEEEALGVSDWAIDRLVARVRNKLKHQNSNFEVVTVKTRGYKLITT